MQTLYAVSMVYQNPEELTSIQSVTVMLEGLENWSKTTIELNAKQVLKDRGDEILPNHRLVLASYQSATIG